MNEPTPSQTPTPTPRTDAATEKDAHVLTQYAYHDFVDGDFARGLERELAEVKAAHAFDNDWNRTTIKELRDEVAALKGARDVAECLLGQERAALKAEVEKRKKVAIDADDCREHSEVENAKLRADKARLLNALELIKVDYYKGRLTICGTSLVEIEQAIDAARQAPRKEDAK